MKAIFKYIAASMLAAVALTGCRDEHLMTDGEGTLRLSATVNSDVEIVSRALTPEQEEQLAESAVIWISNSKGLIHEYLGASKVPSVLRLLAGHYTAEAWVGDSVPASWDKTFYKSGFKGFDIAAGTDTEVSLPCRVANTLASVTYSDAALEMLSSPVMTIGLEDGITDGSHSLVYDESNPGAKGHYMINSRTQGLRWTLTGTQINGETFTKTGLIENIKPATEYALKVNFVGHDLTVGGAYFDIVVEEEPVGDNSQVQVVLPPTIKGLRGFDANNTFRAQEGEVGFLSVFISAASELDEVIVTSPDIAKIIGNESIELIHLDAGYASQLNAAGFSWVTYHDEENDTHAFRINLMEELTETFAEGDHIFDVTAIDVLDKKSQATFTITVSNAPVAPSPVNEASISYTSATLEAAVIKEASDYGFEMRRVSGSRTYEDWTRIAGTVSGARVYAQVTDLVAGATYEYRVYAGDYVSTETVTFSTRSYPQLPNSGFEDWNTSSTPYLLYSGDESNMFWDSGNHGSATMKKNVTLPDESIKHSGKYSVKLASQFVGVGALGKFAAGNLFIGKYLNTDGTDGVLGWGRPWEFRPTALKLWVKYSPVAVTSDNADYDLLKKGDMDNAKIYIALLSDATTLATNSKGNTFGEWPVVVKTKNDDTNSRTLFSKDDANVIGYGEHLFTQATPGSDLIEITIPIDYRSDAPVKNIMLVAAASAGGDYFVGGNGSTMWIDDIELVY